MESLASAGLLRGDYGDYPHAAVAPVGLLALLAAMAGVVYAVARSNRSGHASDAAVAARALLTLRFLPNVAVVLALQMAALCACENIEHFAAFRSASEGLEWLGGPPLAALAVHALIAFAITAAVRRSLASILQTCEALFRAVGAFATLVPPTRTAAAFLLRRARLSSAFAVCVLASGLGLRAPPCPAAALCF